MARGLTSFDKLILVILYCLSHDHIAFGSTVPGCLDLERVKDFFEGLGVRGERIEKTIEKLVERGLIVVVDRNGKRMVLLG